MTNNIFGRSMFLLLVIILVLAPGGSHAAELRTGDQSGTSSTERIADDLYITGGNVVSAGTIIGDLVVTGGNITVSGTVSTDVLVAGGTVTILGNVQDDLRAAGGNITINGTVDGDAIVAGGNVQLTGKRIGGDVVAGGGSIRIDTPVAKDVRIVGGQVILNAPITGNVEVDAQQLTLGASAVIGGNLSYRAAQEMKAESGAIVKGKTTFSPLPQVDQVTIKNATAGFLTLWMLMKFLGTLICALVIGLLFKRYGTTLASEMRAHPWSQLERGLVALIIWPVIAVILMVTILGLSFGMITLLVYIAALIFTSIIVPVPLGSLLYKWAAKSETLEVSWKTILLGSVAYFIIGLIPILGWIFCFVFFLMTLGAMLDIKKGVIKEWR